MKHGIDWTSFEAPYANDDYRIGGDYIDHTGLHIASANDDTLATGAVQVCGDEPQTGHQPTEAALASMNLTSGHLPRYRPLPTYIIPMPPKWLVNMRADIKDLQIQMDELTEDYQELMTRVKKVIGECSNDK